jgi:GTP-sensing pleiotropic transcriptional regulator CodY
VLPFTDALSFCVHTASRPVSRRTKHRYHSTPLFVELYRIRTAKIEESSRNHSWCGKAINITYAESVSVAVVIQRAKHAHHILLSSVACYALL